MAPRLCRWGEVGGAKLERERCAANLGVLEASLGCSRLNSNSAENTGGNVRIGVFSSVDEVGRAAAEFLIGVMGSASPKVLGVATGSSPQPMYAALRQAHAEGRFTLADAKAFALDEYVGIAPNHPERYRNFLANELVGEDKTGLKDENLNVPDGGAEDLDAAAAAYDAAIKASGPVALQILGIGADGHIGFNEPGVSLVCRTHWDALAEQTIADNARFFDGDVAKVPNKCITQGLGTIMEATRILLIATGENKEIGRAHV